MPPKKQPEQKEIPPLGRMSGHLKIGIVGLPNVGKSTFFNTLSKLDVPAENYPFCTIDPNVARVTVPDERFDMLCEKYKPASKVPAVLNVTDIAGLVKGAAEGQGLGNAFLSHIRACDAIFHVCRAFESEDITHVEGHVDPIRDIQIISEELRLKDEEMVDKAVEQLQKVIRQQDKSKKQELDAMLKAQAWIKEGKQIRHNPDWKAIDIEFLNKHQFLTAKRVVYLVNLSERDYIRKKNKWLAKIKAWVDEHSSKELLIPFSGELEAQLVAMGPEEAAKYCKEHECQSALPKIIKVGYSTLRLVNFFTCGEDEVRAWTIPYGYKAPQAAGTIHTDFEKGFICAEVFKFTDFKEYGTEVALKNAGKCLQQGKNYVIEDGDCCYFKVNATAAGLGKKK